MRYGVNTAALALLGAGLLTVAGCGGSAAPTAARTNATASVRTAQEVGAQRNPEASYYLELANQQMATAEREIHAGRMARAENLLIRANADAELAIALTRSAEVSTQAQRTMQHIQDMRSRHL